MRGYRSTATRMTASNILGRISGAGTAKVLEFCFQPCDYSSGVVNWMCCMDFPRVYTDENVVARVCVRFQDKAMVLGDKKAHNERVS